MRLSSIIACAAALVAVMASGALSNAASPRASVKLTECQSGDSGKDRFATFHSRMKLVNGAHRMWMRFTLFERVGDDPPTVVSTPGLRVWRKSRLGVERFGYKQTVAGLEVGGVYHALVRYRWYDAEGRLLRTARKESPECVVAGELPNLRVRDVRGVPGDVPATETYSVDVTNDGKVAAGPARVELIVDGAAPDARTLDDLAPRETRTVRFSGPACRSQIRAVVDRENDVRETSESDNTLKSSCPTAAGASGL